MEQLTDFKSVISKFPTKAELARFCGVDYTVVNQWDRRNSIPATYWQKVVGFAQSLSLEGITLDLLSKLKSEASQ